MRILHAALPTDWSCAKDNGSYDMSTRGVSLVAAGFIHASTVAQLPGVLHRYYIDVEALDLLVIDVERLEREGASVLWEVAEPAGDGPYPHVYGVVPIVAVVHALRLEHKPGTPWQLPDLSAYDVATGP